MIHSKVPIYFRRWFTNLESSTTYMFLIFSYLKFQISKWCLLLVSWKWISAMNINIFFSFQSTNNCIQIYRLQAYHSQNLELNKSSLQWALKASLDVALTGFLCTNTVFCTNKTNSILLKPSHMSKPFLKCDWKKAR